MTTTTNLSLTLVEQAQAQKEVTVNQALVRIDALLNRGVEDKDLATPPGSPAEGDAYIVAATATGDWATHEDDITYFEQIWHFVTPNEGMQLFVADEDRHYVYDGSAWVVSDSLQRAVVTHGSSGSSLAVDLAAGVAHDITLDSATVTLSFSNPSPSGKLTELSMFLRQDGTGSRTVTWPGSVEWAGGSAPTLTAAASALDVIRLLSIDGGSSWQGQVVGLDMQ